MGLFINHKSEKKPKKKAGWKDEAAEYDKWLQGVNSVKLFGDKKVKPSGAKLPPNRPSLREQLDARQRATGNSVIGGGEAGGTVKVHRPEIVYKDNPEMLERELKARERVFPVAPAYNKGGDTLVTEDLMKAITAGGTRRR
jgi:hypothetical protein